MKMYILVGLLTLLPLSLSAAQSINAQEIKYIVTGWGAEGIYVETVNNNMSLEGCGPSFRIESTHPMLKEMLSILLSAFHSGSKVNLYVDGCVGSVMRLNSVGITK